MGRYGTAVLAVTSVGVAAVALAAVTSGPRPAGYLLAAVLLLAGLARAALPLRDAGPLAVRSRPVDVACLLGLAGALAVLTWAVPL